MLACSNRPETVNVAMIIRYLYSSAKHGMQRSSKFEMSRRSTFLQDFLTEVANLWIICVVVIVDDDYYSS